MKFSTEREVVHALPGFTAGGVGVSAVNVKTYAGEELLREWSLNADEALHPLYVAEGFQRRVGEFVMRADRVAVAITISVRGDPNQDAYRLHARCAHTRKEATRSVDSVWIHRGAGWYECVASMDLGADDLAGPVVITVWRMSGRPIRQEAESDDQYFQRLEAAAKPLASALPVVLHTSAVDLMPGGSYPVQWEEAFFDEPHNRGLAWALRPVAGDSGPPVLLLNRKVPEFQSLMNAQHLLSPCEDAVRRMLADWIEVDVWSALAARAAAAAGSLNADGFLEEVDLPPGCWQEQVLDRLEERLDLARRDLLEMLLKPGAGGMLSPGLMRTVGRERRSRGLAGHLEDLLTEVVAAEAREGSDQ